MSKAEKNWYEDVTYSIFTVGKKRNLCTINLPNGFGAKKYDFFYEAGDQMSEAIMLLQCFIDLANTSSNNEGIMRNGQ